MESLPPRERKFLFAADFFEDEARKYPKTEKTPLVRREMRPTLADYKNFVNFSARKGRF